MRRSRFAEVVMGLDIPETAGADKRDTDASERLAQVGPAARGAAGRAGPQCTKGSAQTP